jgi:hypothetical protein
MPIEEDDAGSTANATSKQAAQGSSTGRSSVKKSADPQNPGGAETLQGYGTSVTPGAAHGGETSLNNSSESLKSNDKNVAANPTAADYAHSRAKQETQQKDDAPPGSDGKEPEHATGDATAPQSPHAQPGSQFSGGKRHSHKDHASSDLPEGHHRSPSGSTVHGADTIISNQGPVDNNAEPIAGPRDKPETERSGSNTNKTSVDKKPSLAGDEALAGDTARPQGWLTRADIAVDGLELARVQLGPATGTVVALEGPGLESGALAFTGRKYLLVVGVLQVWTSNRGLSSHQLYQCLSKCEASTWAAEHLMLTDLH